MTDTTAQNQQTTSYVDDYAPPAESQAPTASAAPADTVPNSTNSGSAMSTEGTEAIEDQNIFVLLGIQEATEDEKNMFLDELQQVIWEDFVEKDVELLLTEDELKDFKVIAENKDLAEDDRQAKMVDFLEKLIPDLEKIMLEKAIELKEQMTRQRISEYMEHFKDNATQLEEVRKAQTLADAGKWKSVGDALNKITV